MKKLLAVFSLTLCCLQSPASADVSKAQCVKDAAKANQAAQLAARTAFAEAKIACKGPCHEGCHTAFKTCVGPFRTAGQDCANVANEAFAAAAEACKVSVNCATLGACLSNVEYQHCLAEPRVNRRKALAACVKAEANGIREAQCHKTANACNKACKKAEQ